MTGRQRATGIQTKVTTGQRATERRIDNDKDTESNKNADRVTWRQRAIERKIDNDRETENNGDTNRSNSGPDSDREKDRQ
jgi:hypothetical protein